MTLGRMRDSRGFTLVEVIVTVIATAIVGAIFVNFMGYGMSRTVRAVEMVKGEADAERLMDRIIADYVFRMNADSATALGLMKTDVDNGAYGAIVSARYITFDPSGNETTDSGGLNRTLKISIAASGNDIVALLTRSRSVSSPAIAF
jgi:prepilin-type N-terminal cleavage/methylation domain-containing protein